MCEEDEPQFENKIFEYGENGIKKPKFVKLMEKSAMEKVYRDIGCQRVWILCNIESLEDDLGHIYSKSDGLCRFQLVNGIETKCTVRIEFGDWNENEKGWKNVILSNNCLHTHPSPILNLEGFINWQTDRERNWSTSGELSPSFTPPPSSEINTEQSPIIVKLEPESPIKDESLELGNSATKSRQLRKRNGSKIFAFMDKSTHFEKKKRKVNARQNRSVLVRLMTNAEIEACYDKLKIKKRKRTTVLMDEEGHIYAPNGPTFKCKFANWNTYKHSCPANIYYYDRVVKKWAAGWKEMGHSQKDHNHKSPFPDPQDIQGSPPKGSVIIQSHVTSSTSIFNGSITSPKQQEGSKNLIEKHLLGDEESEVKEDRVEESASEWDSKKSGRPLTELPKSAVTSPQDSLTQCRYLTTPSDEIGREMSQHGLVKITPRTNLKPEKDDLWESWTNCTQCNACILIHAKYTNIDLIVIAKTHINCFHGPVNVVNKKMINHHFPQIFNQNKVKPVSVPGSLTFNDGQELWCAIPKCSAKLMNNLHVKNNCNNLLNHVIQNHLVPGEIINNERFWKCFPLSAPQQNVRVREKNLFYENDQA